MSLRAERSPHGGQLARGAADLPKRKPNLKKLWPQIKELDGAAQRPAGPRAVLMAINRVAGLVLPYISKTAAR